jgi:hypothetical protein
MKRRFFYAVTLFVAVILLSACKDEEEGMYYFRFTADGEPVEFTNQLILLAGFGNSGNLYTASISGANDADSNVGLQIYSDQPITEGTYSGYGFVENAIRGVIIGYKDKKSGILFSSGGGPNVDATIVITEMTATTIKGTFQGKLLASGKPDMTVTNGSFFVRRSN